MRQARDTFLHYLADNLPQYTVRNVRRDSNDHGLLNLAENSINITFVADQMKVTESRLLISISIVHSEELSAVDMMDDTTNLLQASGTAPILDYSNPISPQVVGGNLWWDTNLIKFKPLYSELYSHFGCTLTARYHNQFTLGVA